MSDSITRRHFIGSTAASTAAVGLGFSSLKALAESSPNEKVVVGVMGLSRGSALAAGFAKLPNVEVKYLCDVDQDRIPALTKRIEETSGKAPECITDFRRILDDKSVDALVCAAPNHWHAPATILGCAAGKHDGVGQFGKKIQEKGIGSLEAIIGGAVGTNRLFN